MSNSTITDQVSDPSTFPGVWIAHIGMDAVPNEGQGMLPTPINPIVAAAGQGIGTTLPLNVGDSDDPFFATIDWGDGTGPHIVPVVNGAVDLSNLVAPTQMTDAERENGFGATITVANGNDYFYDVIHPIDDMSTGTLQVYVWSITIGDGGNDDVLVPTDPADDSLPVTLNLPHPTGLAYDMTLSLNYDTDYGPTGVQLWSHDGTTLLLADGSSSMGIQTTPDQTGENYEITGMDDAPAEADVVADYFTLTDITVDTSRSTTQPAAGEQATPKEPVYSNVAHVLDAKLGVSTVDDGNPSGFLSQADKAATGPGAFVPLDNNDWDYLNGTDMDQSGSVVGDKYLLKVIIPAAADAQPGDYYTLSTGGSIRIYTHSDRTGLVLMSNGALPPGYVANKFLANVAHCVYIEGIRDTTTTSPTTLFLNAVVGGVSHTHIDSCKITVFTIIGPLDVPGNGTYSYDVDLSNGPMLAPTGGTLNLVPPGAVPSDSSSITWRNAAEFGEVNFKASGNYVWSCQVNVVKVTNRASPFPAVDPLTWGKPTQWLNFAGGVASDHVLKSGDLDGAAIHASAQPILEGPPGPDGTERGVKWIKFGFIQNAQLTYAETLYTDGATRYSKSQGSQWLLDYNEDKGKGPWSTDESDDVQQAAADPVGAPFMSQFGLSFIDEPSVQATDKTGLNTTKHTISQFKIIDEFHLFLVAESTNASPFPDLVNYVPELELKWHFNGSGNVNAALTWSKIPGTEDFGDSNFGPVTNQLVFEGPAANSYVDDHPDFAWGT